MALIRVHKEDIQFTNLPWKKDPIDYCLECWKFSMGGRGTSDLQIKTMKLSGLKDAYGIDPGEAQASEDMRYGTATGVMVLALTVQHQWALRYSIGLSCVWNFPHLNYLAVAQDARAALEVKLRCNSDTRTLF